MYLCEGVQSTEMWSDGRRLYRHAYGGWGLTIRLDSQEAVVGGEVKAHPNLADLNDLRVSQKRRGVKLMDNRKV